MPTYISMLNWSGTPQPSIAEIRCAFEARSPYLRLRGVHSVAFLPDEGECAAVMVATCRDADVAAGLAAAIEPAAVIHVETMLFDDDPGTPAWLQQTFAPPLPRGAARSLLQVIAGDG
jgi:hypothetical protein